MSGSSRRYFRPHIKKGRERWFSVGTISSSKKAPKGEEWIILPAITCYSLQNHLRTTVPHMGQVETDELYVGIDRKGVHYVFPIQAKGGKDKLNIVQILQDFAMCETKFPDLVCCPIVAQFMDATVIALFEFEKGENGISIASERHYRLVPSEEMTAEDLENYKRRLD